MSFLGRIFGGSSSAAPSYVRLNDPNYSQPPIVGTSRYPTSTISMGASARKPSIFRKMWNYVKNIGMALIGKPARAKTSHMSAPSMPAPHFTSSPMAAAKHSAPPDFDALLPDQTPWSPGNGQASKAGKAMPGTLNKESLLDYLAQQDQPPGAESQSNIPADLKQALDTVKGSNEQKYNELIKSLQHSLLQDPMASFGNGFGGGNGLWGNSSLFGNNNNNLGGLDQLFSASSEKKLLEMLAQQDDKKQNERLDLGEKGISEA